MRFHKLPYEGIEWDHYDVGTGRFGTVGWVSECRRFLLLSVDGSRANNPECYHVKGQYIRFCALNSRGGISSKATHAVCLRDGVLAFVIREIMDIASKYEKHGTASVTANVRKFVKSIRSIKKEVGISGKFNNFGQSYLWHRVSMGMFHKYKEKQRDEV